MTSFHGFRRRELEAGVKLIQLKPFKYYMCSIQIRSMAFNDISCIDLKGEMNEYISEKCRNKIAQSPLVNEALHFQPQEHLWAVFQLTHYSEGCNKCR